MHRNYTPKIMFLTFLYFFSSIAISTDILSSTQSLTNNQTLISRSQIFELGFFSPGNSNKWYLGIWYKQIPDKTVVWVANRDTPLTSSPGTLKTSNSTIVLLDQTNNPIWSSSSNQTTSDHIIVSNPVIQLLDTGNLVLRQENDAENYIWQSFDYPTDTLLPDMKLGWDLRTGLDKYMTSWTSPSDPSPGEFSFKLDFHGFPELFLWNNQEKVYRSGPWNGLRLSGVPEMQPLDYISFNFVTTPQEVYYSFHVSSNSTYSRLIVTSTGTVQRSTWISASQGWNTFWYSPKDQCDKYKECGPYGVCNSNTSPVCQCMHGFEPRNPQAWNLRDGSGGCVRKSELACGGDKFLHLKNVKVPDSTTSYVNTTMGIKECEELCLSNCSCTGYGNWDVSRGGSGCVVWFGELMDMRSFADDGQDFFVRVAAADLGNGRNIGAMIVGISVGLGVLLLVVSGLLIWKRKRLLRTCTAKTQQKGPQDKSQDFLLNEAVISSRRDYSGEKNTDDLELPLFDFDTLAAATDNFCDKNKLGQGGFGCVYKGSLLEGQEIAVKRLSKNSGQGIEEFKNEVRLIARLQHRNLVSLIGCCIETEQKMLVYEYMENRSLDSVIFNKERSSLLNWRRRFNIICGIARGLLYLHQDSRFRIIHRDLKASNILLDGDWIPKISDFGMARIFSRDQTEASTRKVVGTYGYMSPEYAMDGLFSVKSDVFSFGVLVLEIVSGKNNRGFYHSDSDLNLLGHTWRLWKDGRGSELLDASIGSSFSACEVLRCIQVGLLCVQERAEDRPTMSSVVLMLGSDTATIPQPKSPGFCLGRNPFETDSSSGKHDQSFSVNQVTVTAMDAR